MKISIIVLGLMLFSLVSEARKFDFKSAGLAPYVRGSFGTSKLGSEAYAKSSGTSTRFKEDVSNNYSGEFGVVIATSKFNFRAGAEGLFPRTLSDIEGKDDSGNLLFQMDSKLLAIIPTASVEVVVHSGADSKLTVGGGYGIAYVTLENIYRMTTLGTSTYGLSDHTEASKATAPSYQAYTSFEFVFSDNATMVLDLGYRYLLISSLAYKTDVNTFTGNMRAGDTVVLNDRSTRSLDLSGPFVGLAFRFYLN